MSSNRGGGDDDGGGDDGDGGVGGSPARREFGSGELSFETSWSTPLITLDSTGKAGS